MKSLDETRSRIHRVGDDLGIELRRDRLLVVEGPAKGTVLPLEEAPVVIGRSRDVDLRLQDETVSRRHAVFQPRQGGWVIRDLGSKSGVLVEGNLIEEAPVAPGQRFQLGDSVLELASEEEQLLTTPREEGSLHGILGDSMPMREIFGLIRKVGPLGLPVLLHGESGTGKEGIARALHLESPRAREAYEIVDCTLLRSELLRSELFGHEKGAFTGADSRRLGAFERADRGTLLLDEVAEIPMELQPALLRVLEEGEVRRLGGDRPQRVRVRILSATNKDLAAMVEEGTFRADLYFRLSAVTLEVPPLRDRGEDVLLLAESFLEDGFRLSPEGRRALARYSWPGNVRELRNVILRGCGLSSGPEIGAADLRLSEATPGSPRDESGSRPETNRAEAGVALGPDVEEYEKSLLLEAIERCGGNRRKAAAELGMPRSTFYYKLKKYGIV